MDKPKLLAIVFADRVIEEKNNKKGIIGTFEKIFSQVFPVTLQTWGCYIALTNISGKNKFTVKIKNSAPSPQEYVLEMNGEIVTEKSSGLVEVIFNVSGLTVKNAGEYLFEVYINDEFLDSRILSIEFLNAENGSQK